MSSLVVHTLGDVVSAHFGDEDDVALFVPGSAEVLHTSIAAWIQVCQSSKIGLSEANGELHSDLMTLLQGIGVSIC